MDIQNCYRQLSSLSPTEVQLFSWEGERKEHVLNVWKPPASPSMSSCINYDCISLHTTRTFPQKHIFTNGDACLKWGSRCFSAQSRSMKTLSQSCCCFSSPARPYSLPHKRDGVPSSAVAVILTLPQLNWSRDKTSSSASPAFPARGKANNSAGKKFKLKGFTWTGKGGRASWRSSSAPCSYKKSGAGEIFLLPSPKQGACVIRRYVV